jgi:hypothetical protein
MRQFWVIFTCLGSDSIDFGGNDGESRFDCDDIWHPVTCWHFHSHFGCWSMRWSNHGYWDAMASNEVSEYRVIQ